MRRSEALKPEPRTRRLIGAGVTTLLAVAALIGGTAAPSVAAARTPADPKTDFRADSISACDWSKDDRSQACLLGALHQFDEDLAAEGHRGASIRLPSDWSRLTAAQRLFVLTDEDRIARGLPPIAGMDACLDRDASAAAQRGDDPDFACRDAFTTAGGNWSGANSPLWSEFLFVYADGPDGTNADCPTARSAGCWGHRHNVLGDYGAHALMGAADSIADGHGAWRAGGGGGEAEELYGEDRARASFTWAQLQPSFAHPITEASLRAAGVCIPGRTDALSCSHRAAPARPASVAPAAVTGVRVSVARGSAHAGWSAPRSAQRVDGYQVALTGSGRHETVTVRGRAWQGALARGRWTVRVRAHDAAGWGAWSATAVLTVP